MHELFHFVGFCSDSNTHVSFFSIIGDNAIVNQLSLCSKQFYSWIKNKI